jgi:DNA-binding transcriptional LysR family regulator
MAESLEREARPDFADTSQGDLAALLRGGLKLTHMRMIAALDDHEKVSAAASVLNISQPAASRMIAEMEAILGVPLCERLPRGVALTSFGKAFARRARVILLELRGVDRDMSELRSGNGGAVFLGAVTAPAIELAVPAIAKARALYPGIEISIEVDTSQSLARELLASRHDFIIARIPADLDPRLFHVQIIGAEKACLIVRCDHPLAGATLVKLEALNAFDWVMQPRGSLLRQTVEQAFLLRNRPLPSRVLNTTSLLLTLVMVAQTDAIAPVALDVANFIRREDRLAGKIETLPIEFDIVVQPYGLITLKDRFLSPAAQTIYDLIQREAANLDGLGELAFKA